MELMETVSPGTKVRYSSVRRHLKPTVTSPLSTSSSLPLLNPSLNSAWLPTMGGIQSVCVNVSGTAPGPRVCSRPYPPADLPQSFHSAFSRTACPLRLRRRRSGHEHNLGPLQTRQVASKTFLSE